jgi:hypothetical protein
METFEDDVLMQGRDPFAVGVALSPIVFGIAMAFAGTPQAAALGGALIWLGLGIVSYVWVRNPTASRRAARLRVDRDGIYLDGVLWAPARAVTGARLEVRPAAPPIVSVRRRTARLALVVRDLDRGRGLLRALRADAGRSAVSEWALARPFGEARRFAPAAVLLLIVLAFGRLIGDSMPGGLALAVLALVVFFGSLAIPTRVVVGADGVLLRWVGTLRFVPWSRVVAVEPCGSGVALVLDSGECVMLRMPGSHERYDPEGAGACERIRGAWRSSVAERDDDPLARTFAARSNGGTVAWVRGALEVTEEDCDYRRSRVPGERLWRIVENPRADREVRTGAAIALVRRLDPSGRDRLRAAAQGCAEPRLRTALDLLATDAAARASEDALVHALDSLEWEGSGELLER